MKEFNYPFEDPGEPERRVPGPAVTPARTRTEVLRVANDRGDVAVRHFEVLTEDDPLQQEWAVLMGWGPPPSKRQVGDWQTCPQCGEQFFTATNDYLCATCSTKNKDRREGHNHPETT